MSISVTELSQRNDLAIWNTYTMLNLAFESWLFGFILRPIVVCE